MMAPQGVLKNRFIYPVGIILLIFTIICGCMQETKDTRSLTNTEVDTRIFFNDSIGDRIELPHPATRIVAGNSAVAEMLVTIGAGDRIVGITDSVKSRPEIMEKISPTVVSIGTADTPDLETIITLKPDVLLLYGPSSGHQAQNLEKILASDIRVITLDCYKLEGVSNDAYALGVLTDNSEGAERYIRFNRKYLNIVQSRLANLTPDEIPDVYAESGTDFTVLNRVTGIGQVLNELHARNVYGNSTTYEFPKLNPEWVIEKNPDVILKSVESINGANLSGVHSQIISRTGYDQVTAVKDQHVFVYNSEILGRPRVVIGLVYFAKILYPERFADIRPESLEEEYAKEFGFGKNSVEKIYPYYKSLNRSVTNATITVQNSMTG